MSNPWGRLAAWRAVSHGWTHFLTEVIYPTLVVLYLLFVGFKTAPEDPRVLAAYIFLGLYVLILLLQVAQLIHKYERRARYAEAISCIHTAIKQLREAHGYVDRCLAEETEYEASRMKELLMPCMDAVAKAFTIVTGAPNRVCIKVLGSIRTEDLPPGIKAEEVGHVRTMCRDSLSNKENVDRDRDEGDRHKIYKNTAYRSILSGGSPYFFSNDLPKLGKGYENTSREPPGPDGKLPYKACIVLPIRYVRSKDEIREAPDEPEVFFFGFVGVDANLTNVYWEHCDAELGAAFADALSPLLKRSEKAKQLSQRRRREKGRRAATEVVSHDATSDATA